MRRQWPQRAGRRLGALGLSGLSIVVVHACSGGAGLAAHVDAYCTSLQDVLADDALAASESQRPATTPLGFESWPSVYARFVFCAEARANMKEVEPLIAEFRALVQSMNERPADSARALPRARAILEQVRAMPLKH